MHASTSGGRFDYQAGESLANEFDLIRGSVESIMTCRLVHGWRRLKAAQVKRAEVEKRAKVLYQKFQSELSELTIYVPVAEFIAGRVVGNQVTHQLVALVQESRRGGLTILSVLRAQAASQALGAVIERKYAFIFGFMSLYIAILGIVIGIYPVLRPEPKPNQAGQTFFRVGKPFEFAPGRADLIDKKTNTNLAVDICTSKRELVDVGSTVAIVVGRHDQTPLSLSGRLTFSTNAGLAQRRAEVVASFLEHSNECGPAIPTVIKLVAAPRHVGEAEMRPVLLQEDREVTIYGLRRTPQANL